MFFASQPLEWPPVRWCSPTPELGSVWTGRRYTFHSSTLRLLHPMKNVRQVSAVTVVATLRRGPRDCFSVLQIVRPVLGDRPSLLFTGCQRCFLEGGVKRPGREAIHSPLYSAEVRNEWSCNFTGTESALPLPTLKKGKVLPCTGIETLYRPYSP